MTEEQMTNWTYNHRHTTELWDIAAEILSELSRRDEVTYQVRATPESVKAKVETLMVTHTQSLFVTHNDLRSRSTI